jgi:hypothetical protein
VGTVVWHPSVVSRDMLHRHGSRRLVQRSPLSQDTQHDCNHRKDRDSVEEILLARSRTTRESPAQSRRNKVGVSLSGIRCGEDLNVGIGRVRRAAVDKVAVVHQKVYVRYWGKKEPCRG